MFTNKMLHSINVSIEQINSQPLLLITLIFTIAFLESFAIIGLIIPGSIILAAIGVMLGANIFPYNILIAAIMGAFLGDLSSYFIGKYLKEKIYFIWPFNKIPSFIESGESFFHRFGNLSIFLSRFVGPLRPIMPLIAGIMKTSTIKFIIIDFSSALLWAPIYILPGMFMFFVGDFFTHDKNLIVLTSLSLLFTIWTLLFLKFSLQNKNLKSDLLLFIKKIGYNLNKIYLIYALILFLMFILLSYGVFKHLDIIINMNNYILKLITPFYNIKTANVMQHIADLINVYTIFEFSLMMIMILWFMQYKYQAFVFMANAFLINSTVIITKYLIKYPRPFLPYPAETLKELYSFPSGHTSLSISILGLFIYLVKTNKKNKCLIALFTLFVFTIIATRLYLLVHWFSDIVAGILIGSCYLIFSISFLKYEKIHKNKTLILLLGIATLLFLWILNIFLAFMMNQK